MLGGYHGFPVRLGGGKPVARIYHEALRAALPGAIRSVPGSLADCETMATARMLATAWKAQQRYDANLSPSTAYDLLGNWAQRLRVSVRDGDTVEQIRKLCAWKHAINLYGCTEGSLWDACKLVLGDLLVNVEYQRGADLATAPANTFWPVNPGSKPWTSSRSLVTIKARRRDLSTEDFLFLMNVRLAEILDVLAPVWGSWTWEEVTTEENPDISEGFDTLFDVQTDTLWFAEDQNHPQNEFVTRKGLPWWPDSEVGTTLTKKSTTWGVDSLPTVDFGGAGTNSRVGLRCDGFAPGSSNPKFLYTFSGPCIIPGPATGIALSFSGTTSSDVENLFISSGNMNTGIVCGGTTVVSVSNHGAFPYGERAIVACTARQNGSNTDITLRAKTASGTVTFATYTVTSTLVGDFIRFGIGLAPRNASPFYSMNASWGGCVGYKGFGATNAQLDQMIAQWETKYPLS